MNRGALLGAVKLIAVCMLALTTSVEAGTPEVRINVPPQYIQSEGPQWIGLIPGLDSSEGQLLIKIDAEEVRSKISGYSLFNGELRLDVDGIVYPQDTSAIGTASLHRTVSEADCDQPGECVEVAGLCILLPAKYGGRLGVATLRCPISGLAADDVVGSVAQMDCPICSSSPELTISTSVYANGATFEFRIDQQNIALHSEIRALMVQYLIDWTSQ